MSSPISSLPLELLCEIIVESSFLDDLVPLAALQVSRTWHKVAQSYTVIWQTLHLRYVDSRYYNRSKCIRWFTRSEPLPVDITLVFDEPQQLLPLLPPLLPYLDRWRSCTLSTECRMRVSPFIFNSPENSESPPRYGPMVSIQVSPEDDEDSLPEEDLIKRYSFRFDAPSQRLASLQFHVTQLPSHAIALTFDAVGHLLLNDTAWQEIRAPTRDVLECALLFPNLAYLLINTISEVIPEDDGLPDVSLTRLRTLVLRGMCTSRSLLSHISAPCLEELVLQRLNVDFEFSSIPPSGVQDGDSEDEDGDFSQSPSSDHALGMGLRTFIQRCNPPLRSIVMDYADMRTKDFKWCFARLPQLAEFSIVASDMSDKVAQALARPHANGTWLLPALTMLSIKRGNYLTGRALVDLIVSRTRDRPVGPDIAQLKRVSIKACPLFSAQDLLRLSDLCGDLVELKVELEEEDVADLD